MPHSWQNLRLPTGLFFGFFLWPKYMGSEYWGFCISFSAFLRWAATASIRLRKSCSGDKVFLANIPEDCLDFFDFSGCRGAACVLGESVLGVWPGVQASYCPPELFFRSFFFCAKAGAEIKRKETLSNKRMRISSKGINVAKIETEIWEKNCPYLPAFGGA
jgi:hypothetical protein